MPSQRDSVRFVIHNYPNGSHFYVKRPGDGDNFVDVGYQNGAGRNFDGTWITQPIAIPYEESFQAVISSPYGRNEFWLSPYTITTSLDENGNVHIDPRYGVIRPNGIPFGLPEGENNSSRQPQTTRAVYAPVAQEVNAPSRYPVTASVGKSKFKSAGEVIGDYRSFAIHNFPSGSRFYIWRPGDSGWVDVGSGEGSGYRGDMWITSPVLMPTDGTFDIRVQLQDHSEHTWRGISTDSINQRFPAISDPVQIDASASDASAPFWFRNTVSFDNISRNSRIYDAIASGAVWNKGLEVTIPGRWVGTSWNIDNSPTSSDYNGQKIYLVENEDEKKFIVIANLANVDSSHVIHVDASTPASASIQYPQIWGSVSPADTTKTNTGISSPDKPKFGSIEVHDVFPMRKIALVNTAGGNVVDTPASGNSFTLSQVLPDTYSLVVTLSDGRRQRISNVQVSAGSPSVVELTADSIISGAQTPSNHSIRVHGLEQGDRVSLSQPDNEFASAIAEANSDVHLDNIPNGDYTLNVAFANGNMGNRHISLTNDSASTVTYDFSSSRGSSSSSDSKSTTGWIVGGLVIAAGGALAWKYKDKLFAK